MRFIGRERDLSIPICPGAFETTKDVSEKPSITTTMKWVSLIFILQHISKQCFFPNVLIFIHNQYSFLLYSRESLTYNSDNRTRKMKVFATTMGLVERRESNQTLVYTSIYLYIYTSIHLHGRTANTVAFGFAAALLSIVNLLAFYDVAHFRRSAPWKPSCIFLLCFVAWFFPANHIFDFRTKQSEATPKYFLFLFSYFSPQMRKWYKSKMTKFTIFFKNKIKV